MLNDESVLDLKDNNAVIDMSALFSELEKGEESVRKEGWISLDDAEKKLGL